MVKKNDVIGYGFVIVIGVIMIVSLMMWALKAESSEDQNNFEHGWCAAFNGEWIADDTCDIDGKVVHISEGGTA